MKDSELPDDHVDRLLEEYARANRPGDELRVAIHDALSPSAAPATWRRSKPVWLLSLAAAGIMLALAWHPWKSPSGSSPSSALPVESKTKDMILFIQGENIVFFRAHHACFLVFGYALLKEVGFPL